MKPWTRRIEDDFPDFKGVGTPAEFLSSVETCLLHWIECRIFLVVPDGPQSFNWFDDTLLLTNDGKTHNEYANMRQYKKSIIKRSAGILCTLVANPMNTIMNSANHDDYHMIGQSWTHSHTMDVTHDDIYLNLEDKLHRINALTISGLLQWSLQRREPEFFVLENAVDQQIFAGAAIADTGENDGCMFAMIFPDKGRELGIHKFCIPEKQKNMIRNMKIKTD